MTNPPFAVAWPPTAQRDLNRLPEKVASAVIEFAYGTLAEAPHRGGAELHFELEGYRSARRGDFGVIYGIDDDRHLVHIAAIGHRGDVYQQR